MITDAAMLQEELISVNEARTLRLLRRAGRRNQPVGLEVIRRWCRDGVRGAKGSRVRLEHVKIGKKLYTSEPAVGRFVMRLNEESPVPLREVDAAGLAHSRAEAELAAAGI
jgi:hypothetical protein